jgi:hypothetical protein
VILWHDYFSDEPSTSRISHDNETGRWLSSFKPAFDPKDPLTFVLGSMDKPRKMEIFRYRF